MRINVKLKKSNRENYVLHLEWINSTCCNECLFLFAPPAFSAYPYRAHHGLLSAIVPHMPSFVNQSACFPNLNCLLLSFESVPFHSIHQQISDGGAIHQNVSVHRRRRKGEEGKITHAVAAPADKRAAAANLKETMVEICIICGAFSTTVFAEK